MGEDNKEHPVAFSGRSLRKSEKNYSVTEKECLALIEGVKEFYPYLANNDFLIVSDHLSLKWLHEIKYGKGRLFRWSLALQGLTYTVQYRKGVMNKNADALSRRPYMEEEEKEDSKEYIEDDYEVAFVEETKTRIPPGKNAEDKEGRDWCMIELEYGESRVGTDNGQETANIEDLQQMQKECYDLGRIIKYLETGELPLDNRLARQTVVESEDYYFREGVLNHKYSPKNKYLRKGEPVIDQLAVPTKLRSKILYEYHDLAGHNAHGRTYATICKRYFWPKCYNDIFKYCKTCEVCQKIKNHTHPPKTSLGVWPEAEVWERLHMDILGPLPKTKEGYQYILLVVDSFSRWPEAFRLKGTSAIEVADVLYNEVFCRYGAAKQLVSDRGANFLSKVVARLSQLLNIRRSMTSGYRPQCNATCEQFNRTILKCLRAYCVKQEEWDKYLQSIMYGYRATVSTSSTLCSPYQMMFGRQMILPIDIALEQQKSLGTVKADQYVDELVKKLQMVHQVARSNERDYQEAYKERYDAESKDTDFKPGTVLWLKSPLQAKVGEAKKLMMRYHKLVYVKEKLDNNTYIVIDHNTHKQIDHPIHSDRLKKYYNSRDEFPTRIERGEPIPDTDEEETESEDIRDDNGRNLEEEEKTKQADQVNKDEIQSPTNEEVTKNGIEVKDKVEEKKRDKPDEREWYVAEKLLATRTSGGKKYYKVKWKGDNVKPTWEVSTDISDALKRQFHITRTVNGRRRKRFKK